MRLIWKLVKGLVILALFAGYLLALFFVVFYDDLNTGGGGVNKELFSEIMRYPVGSSQFIVNVVGNVVLFVPFGVFVRHYLGRLGLFGFLLAVVLIVGVPCGIEYTQLTIGRVFDVDDILLNAGGGILGYIGHAIVAKI